MRASLTLVIPQTLTLTIVRYGLLAAGKKDSPDSFFRYQQRATRIYLDINLKTARQLGLTFLPQFLARADRVIQ